MTPIELLYRYVELHNEGVQGGGFDAMLALFDEDAVFYFHGLPIAPLFGLVAIRTAFAERPPDDELVVLSVNAVDGAVTASYAWRSAPHEAEGTMRVAVIGGHIASIDVVVER